MTGRWVGHLGTNNNKTDTVVIKEHRGTDMLNKDQYKPKHMYVHKTILKQITIECFKKIGHVGTSQVDMFQENVIIMSESLMSIFLIHHRQNVIEIFSFF
jgi:hypothetical protein